MTDPNFCCLCASDEGVFLDIFTSRSKYRQLGSRSFVHEFETCLSLKVDRDDALSTTICHRCAVELGQCNQFIEKYNRSYDATSKQKNYDARKSCCFCQTTASNNYLFTLAKDFRSSIHPLEKIYECFNRRITREEAERQSICLACRYNLDVLYDLKKLAREAKTKLQRIAVSKAILARLPKTETSVVNRKTTVICQSKLELQDLSDSESEGETMARKRSRSKKVADSRAVAAALKLRTCGQCQTSIEGGVDMYRLHTTGVTVCKMCWITMDPFNNNRTNKRRKQNQDNVKNTKLCAVFLKDVLTDPASLNKNKGLPKDEKIKQDESIYVISDNSEDEDVPLVKSMRNLRNRRSSKAYSSEGERKSNSTLRAKRSLKQSESDGGLKKKLKSVKIEAATTVPSGLRRSARYQSSDSDNVRRKSKAKNPIKLEKDDSGDKRSKKEPKKNGGRGKEPVRSKSEESSSSNSDVGRTSRKVRNKVPLILKPESLPNSPKAQKNVKDGMSRSTPVTRKIRAVSKNLTIASIAKNQPSSKAKDSPKRSKSLMTVSFPFKIRDPYKCKVCRTEYKNKVIGMKHEMTHYKQVEIKIEKLNVTHHFQTIDQNSRTTEIPDASCSLSSPSTNEKPTPTQLEEPASNGDQEEERDSRKKEEESLCPSGKPESVHQDDKSPDIDDTEAPGTVSSTNGLPLEASTSSPPDDSQTETAEKVSPDLDTESVDKLKKVVGSGAEADSVTEENIIDSNGTTEKEIDTVDENMVKESAKETEKTGTGKKGAKDKSEESTVLPSSLAKDVDEDKELGEEMESDTDIRIVDTGSSGEDSNEQPEKVANDVKIVEKVSAPKDSDHKLENDSKRDNDKTETLNDDNVEEENASKVDSVNVENGEPGKKEEPSEVETAQKKPHKKTEEDVSPTSAVTDILQEVMDLATAEVQKRFDSGVASLPETLENISDEIKKTGNESVVAAEKGRIDLAKGKEVESIELDSTTTTNTLEDYLELSNTHV